MKNRHDARGGAMTPADRRPHHDTAPTAVPAPGATRREPRPAWSLNEVRALGVTTDLLTAASILRIGRTMAYQLARDGEFPVPVVRAGRKYLVAVAHLLRLLGDDAPTGLTGDERRASIPATAPADSTRADSPG